MSLKSRQLTYRLGSRRLLDDVSIRILPGRIHAILGPNGAGKSTLLKLLAGEMPPTAGQILLNDQPISSWGPERLARRRAVMQQQDELRFGFQVQDVLSLARLPWAESRLASQPLIEEALTRFDLKSLRTQKYTELSGGERARVQLARACLQLAGAPAPGFLLLDEPFASLDLAFRIQCQNHLSALANQGHGIAVILHEPSTALNWAHDCSLLRRGTLIGTGPVDGVMTQARLSAVYGLPLRIESSNSKLHKTVMPADI